jgi:DNA-binding MarR family transcriptional regulator
VASPDRSAPAALDDERVTTWGLLMETQSAVNAALARELDERLGLPLAWFEVLLRLARTPGERMTMTRLAGAVSFSSGGFSRVADRLEAAGLLAREPCPDNRRSTWAVLTDHGRTTLRAALDIHADGLQRRAFDHLSAAEASELARILRVLRDAQNPDAEDSDGRHGDAAVHPPAGSPPRPPRG